MLEALPSLSSLPVQRRAFRGTASASARSHKRQRQVFCSLQSQQQAYRPWGSPSLHSQQAPKRARDRLVLREVPPPPPPPPHILHCILSSACLTCLLTNDRFHRAVYTAIGISDDASAMIIHTHIMPHAAFATGLLHIHASTSAAVTLAIR